ncbi:MAG: response regulator [Desulfomonile tiedjei]|nr:response regulator [Desulfomonile tiedjei]
MTDRPVRILLVEDNPGDARLTAEVFKYNNKLPKLLDVVEDGVEALAYLRQEGKYADAPRPDLILLDLNLPKKDGRQVLAAIKKDENLRRIPVVVLTTSRDQEDIKQAYDLNANCFLTKPVEFEQFASLLTAIEEFWLTFAELPKE